jgi:hypothetical protein
MINFENTKTITANNKMTNEAQNKKLKPLNAINKSKKRDVQS